MRLGGFALLGLLLFALTSAACTAFDGLSASEPSPLAAGGDDGGPGPQGGGGGAGGNVGPVPAACVDFVSQGTNAYLSVEDAARVCALLPTCDPTLALSVTESMGVTFGSGDYSSCMQWLSGAIPASRVGVPEQRAMLGCLVGKSCSDALACLPYEVMAKGDPRCNGNGTNQLCSDPNTVVDCGLMVVSHCAQPLFGANATCQTGTFTDSTGTTVPIAECALGTCSCDANGCDSPTACVNGNTLETCDYSNHSVSADCTLGGYSCVEQDSDAGSFLYCANPDGQTFCQAVGGTQCQGNRLMVCDGIQLSEFDCAAEGGTCSTEGGAAHCVRPSDKCDFYSEGNNTCVGSNVTLCIDGAPGCFDCSSIGMRCVPDATTGLGRCTP